MPAKFRRLIYDIETSPNVGLFWSAGYKRDISHESIVIERQIITVAWKWHGEKKVHALDWGIKQDDRPMLEEFIPILNSADESVAHYGDWFDLRWLKTRALFHNIPTLPKYVTIDTKAWASKYFLFNSNKLDYLSNF
jgi:DNA polymerase elongation subunit (family B)